MHVAEVSSGDSIWLEQFLNLVFDLKKLMPSTVDFLREIKPFKGMEANEPN